MSCELNFLIMKIGEKIESDKRPNYVDTDKKLHTTKTLQLYMLHCPVIKRICLALCTVKCAFVSEWATAANPHFLINKITNFGAVLIIQFFHLFLKQSAKNIAFFSWFSRVFILSIPGKNVGNLTVNHPNIHCSTHFRARFLYTKMPVLWVCIFLEDEKSIPELSHQKNPNSLRKFEPASSIFITMQDMLLQKSTNLKTGGGNLSRKDESVFQLRDLGSVTSVPV